MALRSSPVQLVYNKYKIHIYLCAFESLPRTLILGNITVRYFEHFIMVWTCSKNRKIDLF